MGRQRQQGRDFGFRAGRPLACLKVFALLMVRHSGKSELGDIVYIDLPDVGAKFKKGAVFGSVESVKG